MNKIFALIPLLGVVWVSLTGCGKDPEPRTGLLFAAGNNLITGNQNVTGSQVYATSLYAQTNENNPYTRFRITRTYDDSISITYLDSALNTTEFGLYLTFGTRGRVGRETWKFAITDKENKEYSREFTLATSSGNGKQPFNNYSSYFYKNSALENLKYFSLRDGTVYPGFIGRRNPQVAPYVDFYFDQDATKNISVNGVATAGTNFKTTTLDPKAFNEVTKLEDLKNVYTTTSSAPLTTVSGLRKNQVIAFKTNTRSGLLRINTINKGWDLVKNDSVLVRMTYDIKAEK